MDGHIVNPTDAKTIALYFYDKKGWRVDANMGRAVNTAKALLKYGYSVDEIKSVMDYAFEKESYNIRSIGFINYIMNETLAKIGKEEAKQIVKKQNYSSPTLEDDDESTKRNKEKLSRLDGEPNVGKKYNFDMFKE